MNCVELKDVSVVRGKFFVLKNINLTIKENTFVSVIGPNGAGKTTLIKIINGLAKVSNGEVKVFDMVLSSKNVVGVRKEIGYVPQHINLEQKFPILVRDVIKIGKFGKKGFFKRFTDEDKLIFNEIVSFIKIEHLLDKPVGHLSGGELQKVSIGRALFQQPKILILDEPTSNLDPKSQYEILQLIEKIYQEKQITTIFVTHILSHIPVCCNDIILVKHGRIYSQGTPEKILREDLLSELYDCNVEIKFIGERRHFHIGSFHP